MSLMIRNGLEESNVLSTFRSRKIIRGNSSKDWKSSVQRSLLVTIRIQKFKTYLVIIATPLEPPKRITFLEIISLKH